MTALRLLHKTSALLDPAGFFPRLQRDTFLPTAVLALPLARCADGKGAPCGMLALQHRSHSGAGLQGAGGGRVSRLSFTATAVLGIAALGRLLTGLLGKSGETETLCLQRLSYHAFLSQRGSGSGQ